MLQQTRVAAVLEKYVLFLALFPTVERLAVAPQSSVLAAWSGLGYYRRARFLHDAAQLIVRERGGRFPETAEQWRELPGIGRYTAAAIASIAFGEKVAVVDGNVERVVERLLGRRLASAEVWAFAGELLGSRRPGDFNQAMMELGATVCVPGEPKCLLCPVSGACATRGNLPGIEKAGRTTKVTVFYALDCRHGKVRLTQRPPGASLMPSMWELPELAPDGVVPKVWLRLKHSITTTNYDVQVVREGGSRIGKKFAVEQLGEIPLTGLARKILRAAEIF
jgi:A/G-specific adenine glycosylase